MKKSISFKLFLTVICKGIWNVIKWFLGLFGYKDESTFGMAVKRVFAFCVTSLVALFTGVIFYFFATDVIYKEFLRPRMDDRVYDETHLSNNIMLQQMYYSGKNRVYDCKQEKVLLEDVDWVVTSEDCDSLAVFARNGKRGYVNRFTGKVAIPENYTRAWIFSEGLAAVEKDGELFFINHQGEVVIDKDFEVYYCDPSYAFKNGYSKLQDPVTGKVGLIDRNGDWALEAVYNNIYNDEGFWHVDKDGLEGLYTADMEILLPIVCSRIYISEDVIEARYPDHTAKRYDFSGNVVVDFVIDGISSMQYETGELLPETIESESGEVFNEVRATANRLKYRVYTASYDDYYGLLSKDGKRITPPLYSSIEPIAKNRYLCQPQGIVIDDNGELVE